MPVAAIIFDLDGTLVDTARDLTEALNYALAPLREATGRPLLSVSETTALVGEGVDTLITKALGNEPASRWHAQAVSRFREFYAGHLLTHTSVYPGVEQTLAGLGKTGLRLAVLSNKTTRYTVEILEGLHLAQHFAYIAGGDVVPEKKPSPLAITHVLEKLGMSASQTVMVGDSTFDIDAAHGAGLTVVAVTYGFRDRSLLKGADYLIDSMPELPGLLPGLLP